ncbi:hypothetical protein [Leifsonia aquatica]|uniref:hypothetical protein n=1 Tax=Leifsonia aquatica TaxID=144185 RepID=UPI00380637CA
MTADASTRSWRIGASFGSLYCALGSGLTVMSILLLRSRAAADPPLYWLLLAAGIGMILVGLATTVVGLARRLAPRSPIDGDDEPGRLPFADVGIPGWIRPAIIAAAVLIGGGCVAALVAAALHAAPWVGVAMIGAAVLGALTLSFAVAVYRIYGGEKIR